MGGLGNDDNRTMGPRLEDGDIHIAHAAEGERRRSIGYRGKLEAAMFVLGAGMGLVIAGVVVVAIVRAFL